jgi:hypothetical protein
MRYEEFCFREIRGLEERMGFRGGDMAQRSVWALLLIGAAAMSLLSSCTLMQYLNPPQGQVRLLRLQMLEIAQEDLPYDITVTFEADGRPTIKKACFRWLTERASLSSPPLYCYATETQGNQPIDSVCSRWTTDGPYAEISPLFCSNIERIEYGAPGSLLVKIQTKNVVSYYKWLECYVEYIGDGVVKQSNKIKAPTMVIE